MNDILEHFAKADKPAAGFSLQQVMEEKLKASLIVERPDWRPMIDHAEGHRYFRGQIEFLLDFSGVMDAAQSVSVESWDDSAHLKLQSQFSDYFQKATAMFTSNGLSSLADYRWERALLCIGDYLLPRGRNISFLVNSHTDQASWKRLLRGTGPKVPESRKLLLQLWKRLDGTDNLEAQLDAVIDGAADLEPWRYAFVRTPDAISYCSRRMIRWNTKDEVYLLQTTQMNGTHAELFTYCLYKNTLTTLNTSGCLKPLKLLSYQSQNSTDIEPGISLQFRYDNNFLRFKVEFDKGQFIIYIPRDEVTPYPLIQETLLEILGFAKDDWFYIKKSYPDLIETMILELGEKLAATPSPD